MGGLGSLGTVLRLAFFAPFPSSMEDWLIIGVESVGVASGDMSCSGGPTMPVNVNP